MKEDLEFAGQCNRKLLQEQEINQVDDLAIDLHEEAAIGRSLNSSSEQQSNQMILQVWNSSRFSGFYTSDLHW